MAESVGIRALQQHASAVVARAVAGEEVVITDRGRPVARLVPIREGGLQALIDQGLVTPAKRPLADLLPPLPQEGGLTATEILADMRDQERY